MGDPVFVVLDEPSSNLDAAGEAALRDTITQMKAAGMAIIAIEHKAHLLQSADFILHMAGPANRALCPKNNFSRNSAIMRKNQPRSQK